MEQTRRRRARDRRAYNKRRRCRDNNRVSTRNLWLRWGTTHVQLQKYPWSRARGSSKQRYVAYLARMGPVPYSSAYGRRVLRAFGLERWAVKRGYLPHAVLVELGEVE